MMRIIKLITVGALCSVISSCALAQSALRLPGTLLQAAGRTTGFVNNEEAPKTEIEKEAEKVDKIY